MEEFNTIAENMKITAEIVEKKSKFIANIFYIDSVEEADNIIKAIKKKYYDAKHNCIAYRVMVNDKIVERSSDGGEPSGTAGAPMLAILQKNNLCNILVVVTRYFGGILLGTGGLVSCYSQATLDALEKAPKIDFSFATIESEASFSSDRELRKLSISVVSDSNSSSDIPD